MWNCSFMFLIRLHGHTVTVYSYLLPFENMDMQTDLKIYLILHINK